MPRTVPTSPPARPLPAADETFTIRDVVHRGGTSVRTVRHYVAQKVLVAPPFRSSNTRYDRAFLVRFEAALALRARGAHLPAIRAQLDAMPFHEMAILAGYAVDPATAAAGARAVHPGQVHRGAPAVSRALGAAGHVAGAKEDPALPAGFAGPYRAGPSTPAERWEHFEVCPGVRLLVRTEADAESWRVAREMLALFAAATG